MKLVKTNYVSERYSAAHVFAGVIDDFAKSANQHVEVKLDAGETVASVVTGLRAVTYSKPQYKHIKIKQRGDRVFMSKEEL